MTKTTAEKEASARAAQCFDRTLTHLRAGSWRGREDAQITLLGRVSDLHGSVCTCCPKREPEAVVPAAR